MGSKKIRKKMHPKKRLGQKNRKETTPSEKLWDLTNMDWDETMANKKIKKEKVSQQKEWDRKNGKQTTPSDKVAYYKNAQGPQHGKQNNHKRNWQVKKMTGTETWEPKCSK